MSRELFRCSYRLTYLVFGLAPVLAAALVVLTIMAGLSPLERHYLVTYFLTTQGGSDYYRLLVVKRSTGKYLATERDVAAIPPNSTPPTEMVQRLTTAARDSGVQGLEWIDVETDNAKLHRDLQSWIYHGRSIRNLALPAVLGALAVLIFLPWAVSVDREEFHRLRKGVIRKGPVRVGVAEFSKDTDSDGIGFTTTEPSPLWERLRNSKPTRVIVRIPRRNEAGHFLLVGDSGSGKSSVIREVLRNIRERGETAVVYDPELDFTPEFLDPARGDVVCNPIDARMPYWNISDEVNLHAAAFSLARSLFPDARNGQQPASPARAIFTYVLEHFRPSTEELTTWLSDLKEVESRIATTPVASLLADSSCSIANAFQNAATGLQLLPTEHQCVARWNTAAWASERRGWIFFPVRCEARESTRLLVSLWLDAVLLHLVASAEAGMTPAWIILDDVGSLEHLAELSTVITGSRKANIRLVLGIRNRAQLVALYGTTDADRILNQPLTKIFLRSSDLQTAKWISESIGDVEIERLVADEDFLSWRRRKIYYRERKTGPLVMASEIQGLPDRSAWLRSGNLVVQLKLRWIAPKRKERGFIPRHSGSLSATAAPVTSAPPPATGGGRPIFD
jgi:hypothetical protein